MAESLTPEERWQIQDLHARYVLGLDVGDVEAVIALFLPDAEFATYGVVFAGHDGLRRMMSTAPAGLHLGGHVVVEPAEFGARARQQLVFVTAADHALRLAVYDDEIVRLGSDWKFRRRECRFLDRSGTLAERPQN